jgi:dipeptidyl aminopeptidase/acylaminoacyl peptidase
MTALHRSAQANMISGIVLDAPVVDWRKTLKLQAEKRNVHWPITNIAMWMVEKRAGLDIDDFTQASKAKQIDVPVLLLQGESDESVPVGAAEQFAASNPAKIQLGLFPSAQHTAEWNADTARYARLVTQFLALRSN